MGAGEHVPGSHAAPGSRSLGRGLWPGEARETSGKQKAFLRLGKQAQNLPCNQELLCSLNTSLFCAGNPQWLGTTALSPVSTNSRPPAPPLLHNHTLSASCLGKFLHSTAPHSPITHVPMSLASKAYLPLPFTSLVAFHPFSTPVTSAEPQDTQEWRLAASMGKSVGFPSPFRLGPVVPPHKPTCQWHQLLTMQEMGLEPGAEDPALTLPLCDLRQVTSPLGLFSRKLWNVPGSPGSHAVQNPPPGGGGQQGRVCKFSLFVNSAHAKHALALPRGTCFGALHSYG